MSTRLEQAFEKAGQLPPDMQDVIADRILAAIADEEAWDRRFQEKRDIIRRMAAEAIDEDRRGETRPLEDLLG